MSIFGIDLELEPSPSPNDDDYPRWIVKVYDDGDAAITCPRVGKRCGNTGIVHFRTWVGMPDKTTKKGRVKGEVRSCPYCSITSRIPRMNTAAQIVSDYDLFLFDLDGTLISSYMENEDKDFHTWDFLPGRKITLDALKEQGKKIGIVTNQAGVGFGFNTEDDFLKKVSLVKKEFGDHSVWVCYAHGKADHPSNFTRPEWDPERRKPSPDMIYEALESFEVEPEKAVYIGDMESDEQAALRAGVDYVDAVEFFA